MLHIIISCVGKIGQALRSENSSPNNTQKVNMQHQYTSIQLTMYRMQISHVATTFWIILVQLRKYS